MKTTITSNIGKTAARYRAMAKLLPQALKAATQDLAQNEALPLYEKTVATWQHAVDFQVIETPRGHTVQTEDQVYKYIDRGTRVRRALMSRDWRSKTKVNVISSFSGAGKMLFVSRKLSLPGIEARNFSQIILRRVQDKAASRVRKALNEAAAGAGFGL